MTTKTYDVLVDNLPELESRLAGLNKKAAKLGCAPIVLTKGATRIVTETVRGKPAERVRQEITLAGDTPKVNGWEFVALLQHEDGGTIVKATPRAAEGALKGYRNATPSCDHCQMNRRRNDTFVLMNEAGAFKQVGRNCLVDFLGHANPHALAAYAELLMVADDFAGMSGDEDGFGFGGFGGGNGPRACGMVSFLRVVVAAIREGGWLSRTKARELGRDGAATADLALAEVFRKEGSTPVVKSILPDDGPEAERLLALVGAKFEATNPEALSDYEHNLRVSMLMGYVTAKTAGIAGSLVVYARREEAKLAEARAVASGERKHVGTIGERATFVLTITGMHSFETDYGVSTWVNFVDATGNKLAWKASGTPQAHVVDEGGPIPGRTNPDGSEMVMPAHLATQRIKVGTAYEVVATVEKHATNRKDGVTPETILKRCVVSVVGVEAWQAAEKVKAKEAKKVAAREKRAAAKKAKSTGEEPALVTAKGE